MAEEETRTEVSVNDEYIDKYGFHEEENYTFKSRAGLDEQIVRDISRMKKEPQWMTDFRLRSLETFFARPMPNWGKDQRQPRLFRFGQKNFQVGRFWQTANQS